MDLFDEEGGMETALHVEESQPQADSRSGCMVAESSPSGTFVLPGSGDDVLCVPVSGGADSTVLAMLLKQMFPEARFRYVFTDTGAEPDELYDVLDRLEQQLGVPIERLAPDRTLWELIEDQGGFLPSSEARWCTRLLKSERLQDWLKGLDGRHVHMFVGIRADETFRLALTLPGVTTHMPYIDLGWKRADVFRMLSQTIGVPRFYAVRSRSGCGPCPFQRRQELIGQLQVNPEGFGKGESYEKLSDADMRRHGDAPSLSQETRLAANWLWLPRPKGGEVIDGKLGCRSATLFGDVGLFVGAEFFLDCAPGDRPFVWQSRIVSFSRSLGGIKKQLNTRFSHLLATCEVHEMDQWDVRNRVEFAIYYLEAPAESFDPAGTGVGSFTWHAGESYRMLRHVVGWAGRILAAHELERQALSRDRFPETSAAWEFCDGSIKALKGVENPTGRVVAMGQHTPREPDLDDVLDERFVTCAACSL